MNSSGPFLLSVRNLCVRFRLPGRSFRAVDDVSLDVAAGETLAVVGESGCGKTTLALAILRLLSRGAVIESGSITLSGRELTGFSEREMRDVRGKDVGMIFQEPLTALNPVYTVGEQIAEGLRLHEGLGRRAAWQRAIDTLNEVGVPDPARRASAYPHQLSGGQRQRAMIAAAIACRPALLLADEPTTALDVGVQGQILDLLRKLQAERGLAILLITHDLGVVAEMAQRVAIMYAGQIVEQAAVRDLFAKPQHPYTRGLLGCLPRLEAPPPGSRRLPVLEGSVPDLSQLPPGCRFANRCPDVMDRCQQEQGLRSVGTGLVRCIHGDEKTGNGSAEGQIFSAASPPRLSPPPTAILKATSGVARRSAPQGVTLTPSDLSQADFGKHSLLEVHDLVKRYGTVRAVDGVSFSVNAGETLALVGESGCGKTTTGRCLLGLLRPDAGNIFFEGHNLRAWGGGNAKLLKQRMQMVFQDPFSSLNPRMTVGQTLTEPLWIHSLCERSALPNRVAELLDMVGLPSDYAGRHPHELSGGQRQRVVIARALALDPRLIVADEPVSALDVSVQAQILNLMLELQERLGVAFLLIAHNLQIVRRVAQRTAVMYLGRIVEYGPTEAIFTQPRHPYTQALLSAVPEADPFRPRRQSLLTGDPPDARAVPAGCRFHPRCGKVMEECKRRDPDLLTIGEQQAACWLYEEARTQSLQEPRRQ